MESNFELYEKRKKRIRNDYAVLMLIFPVDKVAYHYQCFPKIGSYATGCIRWAFKNSYIFYCNWKIWIIQPILNLQMWLPRTKPTSKMMLIKWLIYYAKTVMLVCKWLVWKTLIYQKCNRHWFEEELTGVPVLAQPIFAHSILHIFIS